jgi:hypothetical protein
MRNLLKHLNLLTLKELFVTHFRHFKSHKNKNKLLYHLLYINPKKERYNSEAQGPRGSGPLYSKLWNISKTKLIFIKIHFIHTIESFNAHRSKK